MAPFVPDAAADIDPSSVQLVVTTGANESGIFVHIGRNARDRALAEEKNVVPFEPMEGTVMKDYLLLQEKVHANTNKLKRWLDQSSGYLLALPPKKK